MVLPLLVEGDIDVYFVCWYCYEVCLIDAAARRQLLVERSIRATCQHCHADQGVHVVLNKDHVYEIMVTA